MAKLTCDKRITAQRGKWEFDKAVADQFDSHVKKSTPQYNRVQDMVTQLADWFVGDGSAVYDLGASTGTTIRKLRARNRHKDIKYVLIDSSADMIRKARKNLEGAQNVHFTVGDITRRVEINDASLVLCLYTLQFVRPEHRRGVIRRTYCGLKDGSALILVEKVLGSSAAFDSIYTEIYHDLKLRQGLSAGEIENKAISLRGVLRPYTLEQNLDMLRAAGFREVETFFRWFNFVGIIAIK